jgi:hypothetical protein
MSEHNNSGIFSKGIILVLIALFFCNRCVYTVLEDTEITNNTKCTQMVFVDSSDVTIDGNTICPAIKCSKGGFLSQHTQMLYKIEGDASNIIISDAFTKISSDEYLYNGKLVTDSPFVPIFSVSNPKGGETLEVSLIEDGYTRIKTRNAAVNNKFYVVPREENQSFDNWMDSCRVVGLNDVDQPFYRAVFISEGRVEKGIFIGESTPSEYESVYIARLNRNAYKDRNNTPLQIKDVEITYHCIGSAANVALTFEPLTDTLNCSFLYQTININHWRFHLPRTVLNMRFGSQNTTIVPGQTKYEFNITPDIISNTQINRITDIALVGVEVGDLESKQDYIYDYDHRSSFLQKITLNRDLSASLWKLLISIALMALAWIVSKNVNISNNLIELIVNGILIVIFVLTIAYSILWLVLSYL